MRNFLLGLLIGIVLPPAILALLTLMGGSRSTRRRNPRIGREDFCRRRWFVL